MKLLPTALVGIAIAAPATAQPIQVNAVLSSEMGYITNPFLAPGVTKGSIYASASVAPHLSYETARSVTNLDASYNRATYLHDFGYTDSGYIALLRTDHLTQFVSNAFSARYQTSNTATISDPTAIIDPLAIGRRTKTISASDQVQWQLGANDQLVYGAQVSHVTYGNNRSSGVLGRPSAYTQYAANAGYNHTLDARTTVGAQVSVSTSHSKLYPSSRTIQPSLTAKRQLSAAWTIDGHVGMVFSTIEGPVSRSTTSLGIGANLCGTYPLTHICLKVTRDTQPSGYGPLRTTSSISLELMRTLDEHSRLTASAQYSRNGSGNFGALGNTIVRNAKVAQLSVGYDRDLTQRVSVGVDGRAQRRELSGYSTAHSYSALLHVRAKLGRI